MAEILLTEIDSDVSVTYNGKLFILDFAYDTKIINLIRKEIGEPADWNIRMEKKWTVPKEHYSTLVKAFSETNYIKWKPPEKVKENAQEMVEKEETLEEVLERIPKKIETPFMKIEPYNFQKVAVGWATTKKGKRGKIYGGLLGDLMGLGKTIEALAVSGFLKHQKKVKKCLIICPATLKMQWGQEIEKFTNERYVLIDAKGANARDKRKDLYDLAKGDDYFYTIVNYELLYQKEITGKTKKGKQKKGDYWDLKYILENDYDMVVIDEAHRMKNPDTETAKAIREIQPDYRLLMTGTPIEKDLQNIFQLMDYLSPNIFGNKKMSFDERRKVFEEKYLTWGWNPFKLKYKVRERMITGVKNVGLLKQKISPYMLRRTTEDVSDEMPDVVGDDSCIVVDWTDYQRRVYNRAMTALMDILDKQGKAKTEEEAIRYENQANEMMLYMLEICDTPELLNHEESSPTAKKLLGDKVPKNLNTPKLERLKQMVEDIITDTGEKIVIFTKFERMTRIIQRELSGIAENVAKSGYVKAKPFDIKMYTGKTAKGCKWKTELDKSGESSENLACNKCPFAARCDTRTKAAWYFQNDPNTKVIVCTDAANYGVNKMALIS